MLGVRGEGAITIDRGKISDAFETWEIAAGKIHVHYWDNEPHPSASTPTLTSRSASGPRRQGSSAVTRSLKGDDKYVDLQTMEIIPHSEVNYLPHCSTIKTTRIYPFVIIDNIFNRVFFVNRHTVCFPTIKIPINLHSRIKRAYYETRLVLWVRKKSFLNEYIDIEHVEIGSDKDHWQ